MVGVDMAIKGGSGLSSLMTGGDSIARGVSGSKESGVDVVKSDEGACS